MRVIARFDFHDNLKDVDRRKGEEFVVTQERYDEINAIGQEKIGEDIVAITAADPEPAKQTPEKRASAAKSARKKAKKDE